MGDGAENDLLIFLLGIITALIGFGVNNFLIKPIMEYKKFCLEIGNKLLFYSHIITSPGPSNLAEEASREIRGLATKLEQVYLGAHFKKVLRFLRILPLQQSIVDAKGSLIRISNTVYESGNTEINVQDLKNIYTELDIKELTPRYNSVGDND